MPDLSDELKKKEVMIFYQDFSELIRVADGIDRDYIKARSTLDFHLPEYKTLVNTFTKKYHGISVTIKKTPEHIILRMFLKEKGLKECLKIASRIAGLKSLGVGGFDEVQITSQKEVSEIFEEVEDSIYLSYANWQESATIVLKYDRKQKKAEMIYDIETVSDINLPEFKLIAYYALKSGYKNGIDFYEKASIFSFYDVLKDDEKNKWLKKFNPRFLE